MAYRNVLVAVAVAADSHLLVERAVSLVRPNDGQITLVSTIATPEIYAGPMLGDLRALMEEEALLFMEELCLRANYPAIATQIIHGELGDSLSYANQKHPFDLVICCNHSDSIINKVSCSAARFINTSKVDVLIVPL